MDRWTNEETDGQTNTYRHGLQETKVIKVNIFLNCEILPRVHNMSCQIQFLVFSDCLDHCFIGYRK